MSSSDYSNQGPFPKLNPQNTLRPSCSLRITSAGSRWRADRRHPLPKRTKAGKACGHRQQCIKYLGATVPATPIFPGLDFLKPGPGRADRTGRRGKRTGSQGSLCSDPQTFPHKVANPLGRFVHWASAQANSLGVLPLGCQTTRALYPQEREEDRTGHTASIYSSYRWDVVPTSAYPSQGYKITCDLPPSSLASPDLTSLPSTCLWV